MANEIKFEEKAMVIRIIFKFQDNKINDFLEGVIKIAVEFSKF